MKLPRELTGRLERYGLSHVSDLRSIDDVVHKVEQARGKPTGTSTIRRRVSWTGKR